MSDLQHNTNYYTRSIHVYFPAQFFLRPYNILQVLFIINPLNRPSQITSLTQNTGIKVIFCLAASNFHRNRPFLPVNPDETVVKSFSRQAELYNRSAITAEPKLFKMVVSQSNPGFSQY